MSEDEPFALKSDTLGALPIINHFLARLQLESTLKRYLCYNNSHHGILPGLSLGVLLRNIILGREPVYGLKEWASTYTPQLFSLEPAHLSLLNDDRIGRALEKLFDADRASLMTEVVIKAIHEFQLELSQLHNDSTSLTFSGVYEKANGVPRRGKRTLKITHGHNKDHRPDLKQLLWILTVTADGAVPIHYRTCDGNTTDDTTHIDTWNTLRSLVGHPTFIYVADSKLCVGDTLKYIDQQGGCFITVLLRTRSEDKWFREYIVGHEILWEEMRGQSPPRQQSDPPEVWRVVESPIRSAEGFRIVWVWSSQKAEYDMNRRQAKIEKSILRFEQLKTRLDSNRCRLRTRGSVAEAADEILKDTGTQNWLSYDIKEEVDTTYRQTKRGRPGPNTQYVAQHRTRFQVEWHPLEDNIYTDACSDGMFPLITNSDELSLKDILDKYKYQPQLEKRHEQLKSVSNVTPVLLKSITRIEALLFVYFIALLVQSLIERELRLGMTNVGLKSIPIYHEERHCRAPTASRVLAIFNNLQRHYLIKENEVVQTFNPRYTGLQVQILDLLAVPKEAYPGLFD